MATHVYADNEIRAIFTSFCDGGGNRHIIVDGKSYWFDFSERFGPNFVTKTGRELDQNRIPDRAIMATGIWQRQGSRVRDGVCFWQQPPTRFTFIRKRMIIGGCQGAGYDISSPEIYIRLETT
jgi:hypothetical protein